MGCLENFFQQKMNEQEIEKFQNELVENILEYVSKKSGITVEDLRSSETIETAVARYCIANGAKMLQEKDLQLIIGNANVGPCNPNLLENCIVIEYKNYNEEQVQEMAKILQGQSQNDKLAGSLGNVLLISFDNFCTLNLHFEKP